jgi:hypothetical protein
MPQRETHKIVLYSRCENRVEGSIASAGTIASARSL